MEKPAIPPSLLPHIGQIECLNQDSQFTLDNCLKKFSPLQSDCDEQLLINCSFQNSQAAKIHALRFVSLPEHQRSRPATVRVFLNERNVLFANVSRLRPTEEVRLQWVPESSNPTGAFEAVAYLKKCKFVVAFSLTIFIADNEGDEEVTIIDGFDILGDMATGLGTSELPAKK